MTPIKQRIVANSARALLGLSLALAVVGCEGEAGVPKDGTPIVDAASDKFRQAQAETDKKIADDAAAEAKARARFKGAPPE